MTLRHLVRHAIPYRKPLAFAACLMLLESLVALAVPGLAGRFAGGLLQPELTSLSAILLLLSALFAVHALLRFVSNELMGKTALRISTDLRGQVYEHLQSLPLAWFHEHRQGDLLAMLTHETDELARFISNTLLGIPVWLFTVSGAMILMILLDPLLALLIGLLVPLFYLLLKIIGRQLRPLAGRLQDEYAQSVAMIEENLGMLPAIKTFTREDIEAARYHRQCQTIYELGCRENRIYALLEPVLQFVSALAVLLLLWLASDRILAETMSIAELVSILLYAALLTRPVSALASVYGQIQTARGALARLERMFSEAPESDAGESGQADLVRGAFRFEGVHFCYPGRSAVLVGLDLQINAGETIAIVGENGSGKTTLIHLLLRLYEPQHGHILLDDVDIRQLDLRFLRQQIALVSQQVLLSNDSIGANIAYARPGASRQEIETAATQAQLHAFVASLPQGYDTLIGDRGIRLSGGQQQRLALARALLKQAPILILDEATAMFDPAGERSLIETCQQVLAPLTVILVTHRPASLALADRILQLRCGKLELIDMETILHKGNLIHDVQGVLG
jgi:ATP-binding cassette, subfamily B, bacterial